MQRHGNCSPYREGERESDPVALEKGKKMVLYIRGGLRLRRAGRGKGTADSIAGGNARRKKKKGVVTEPPSKLRKKKGELLSTTVVRERKKRAWPSFIKDR